MGDKFVLLKQKNHPNIIPTYNDLINKSTEQILELYAKSKMALIFNGPYFSEPIQAHTIPLIAYPELALTERPTEYSTAPYYLSFEELQYQKQLALFVKPEVEEFEIPLFKIVFNLDDVKTGKDILKLIDDNFDLPHSNGSTTSFWPSDTAQNIFQKARIENIKFCCQLEEKSLKLIKKRVDILKEINDTEYRYIEDLSVILDIYQPFLAKSSSFNASEMNTIFKDIPTIRNFHRNFSENIKEREQKYESIVGDVFLAFSEFFKISLPYISNYDAIISLLNSKPSKFLTISSHEEQYDVSSYLITPIQRIPRYILFIRELLKNTPKCHPDYVLLSYANDKIQNVTFEMDSATKKAQQMNEIWNIQKALSHSFNIISPNRFVRKTFHVTFMKVPCHLYIFNDLITINSYDRKSQTVLFSSRIINFLYFPSYDQIGIWMKKKLYLAVFESENDRAEFVSLVEDLRAQQSARNSVNLIFLWSNPFIPRTLPKLRFIDGVQINDTYLFFGENFLINCNFKLRKVSVSETPIGIRTGFAMAGNSTDKVYLVGGKNEEEYYDDVWLYEILYSTWTKLSEHEFPPRCEHSVIYDDRKLIIFGGRYKKQFYNDIHIFYPYTSTWEKYTDLNNTPIPRSLHSAVLIKRKMIIHGGHNSKTVFNDVCAFDIDKFQWDTTPEKVPLMINQSSIPKRYGHRTIALQNILINIGGTENGEEVQIPSVIFTNENNRCTIFDSGGNWPNSLESFALCFDYENRHLVIYSQCSIFSGLIPSEIENAYLDSLEQERTSYRFQLKRSEKRQSALLEEGELYQNCLARRRLQKCRHTKKETTTESTRKAINLLDFDLDHQLDVPNKNENPDSFNNPIKDNSKGFNSPEQNESLNNNNNNNSQNNYNDIQNNNNDIQNNNNDSQNNNNDSQNKNDRVSFSPSPFKVTFSPKIMPNTYTENFPSVGTPKNENSNGNNSIQLNCLARPRLAGRRYSKQERKFFTQFGSESSENSNQEINSPEIKRIDDLNEKPSLRQSAQIRSSLSQNTSQFMPNIKIDQKTDPSFQTKSSDNIPQMREKNRLKFGKVDTRSPQKKPQIYIDQTEINNQTNNSGTNK